MGSEWDSNKFCPYTGRRIYPHPAKGGLGEWQLVWFREGDGERMKSSPAPAETVRWIEANPETFAEHDRKFNAWIATIRGE